MAELTNDDVTLTRVAAPRKESELRRSSAATKQGERPLRPTATRRKRAGAPETPPPPTPSSDRRLRAAVALLLMLGGVLLFFALISYSPFDQANTDFGASELVGLFTNDPLVSARADTTSNWLGLLGAWVANVLINGVIGYFSLVFAALCFWWGVVVFQDKGTEKGVRISLYSLLVATLVASFVGVAQRISWIPSPPHEWVGAVGAFIASILATLLGSIGATLLLVVAVVIALAFALDLDLKQLIGRLVANRPENVGGVADAVRERLAGLVRRMSRDDAGNGVDSTDTVGTRRRGRRHDKLDREDEEPIIDRRGDDEPARMMRRIDAARSTDIPMPETIRERRAAEPAIRRPELNAVPPEPERRLRVVEAEQPTEQSRLEEEILPPVENRPKPAFSDVEITHYNEAPPLPSPSNARLTVNVQEGETDEDVETEHEGELIDGYRDEQIVYDPPSIELLHPQSEQADVDDDELKTNARLLQEKLSTFNIEIENLTVTPGPVVTLYEFVPAAGIKLSQIESLGDDIALALKARGIRIIAPIPGKGTVGVEIPNHHPAMVRIRSVLNTTKFREADLRLPLALGKTTVGEVFCDDLTKMPHLLIAGATGSGKSVGINAILASLIYRMHPSDLKLAIIDPKKIELTPYRALVNHFLVQCPDIDEDIVTSPTNAVLLLKSVEMEMDRRYDVLAKSGQRNIFDYNKKVEEGTLKSNGDFRHTKLPYIVVIVDELADLMITAAKEVEEPIARLAQLARAIGIHLIVATQRPSVDVITGMIKANFPARIAYQVATKIDSRTILDMNGAEQLLGNGDMLYLPGGRPKPLRLQNAFISTEEVEAICEHVGVQVGYTTPYRLPSVTEKKKGTSSGVGDERDELFDEAARLIVRHQQGSVSLLQRRLKVGYARAARIVDELEDAGIVGPFDGSKARAVLLESEAELEAYL